jgi:hypothetical protein
MRPGGTILPLLGLRPSVLLLPQYVDRSAVPGKDRLVLIVYFPSVADDEDKDRQDIVFNLVDDAVVADADAVKSRMPQGRFKKKALTGSERSLPENWRKGLLLRQEKWWQVA